MRTKVICAFALMSLATACGGGGTPTSTSSVMAPEGIEFGISEARLETDEHVVFHARVTDGDSPTRWDVLPPLPPGLSLDSNGRISGTPSAPAPRTTYWVTAGNEGGETTVQLTFEVIWAQFRSLDPKQDPTDADIRHFLERTHFGYRDADFAAIVQNGLASHIDDMTTMRGTSGLESQAAAFLTSPGDPSGRFPTQAKVAQWALHLMVHNPNPFQEVLAQHWHNHFATSSFPAVTEAKWMVPHMNIWRHRYVGNLRTMILEMTRDMATLKWLDGFDNDAGDGKEPNENFAREFFELFCLGVDTDYTEADIQEAARAFSGYRLRFQMVDGSFEGFSDFDHERHDHAAKFLLGGFVAAQTPGPTEHDDFADVVDLTLALNDPVSGAPRVGQWIVRNLIEAFCFDDPPQNVIDDLAIQLKNDGWVLLPMIRRLLASEMFFSNKSLAGRVKGPSDYLVGFMRATGLTMSADWVEPELVPMRHVPTQPPSVNGWPGGTAWLSAQATMDTANLLHAILVESRAAQEGAGNTLVQLLPFASAPSDVTVDSLTRRLNIEINDDERARAILYLETDPAQGAVPWDPTNLSEAETRLRGLLWILCQHPTYRVR